MAVVGGGLGRPGLVAPVHMQLTPRPTNPTGHHPPPGGTLKRNTGDCSWALPPVVVVFSSALRIGTGDCHCACLLLEKASGRLAKERREH